MNERLWLPSRNIYIFIIIYSFIFLLWINSLNFHDDIQCEFRLTYVLWMRDREKTTDIWTRTHSHGNKQRQSEREQVFVSVTVLSMVNKLVDVEIKWIFTALRLYAYNEWLMEHILRFIDLREMVFFFFCGRLYFHSCHMKCWSQILVSNISHITFFICAHLYICYGGDIIVVGGRLICPSIKHLCFWFLITSWLQILYTHT